ncbi:FIG004556: membrane metalloprotease [hydrothermal vent metagenome]|uniref:FIG004556: membrane metalloprotease n=1 Tax=hydrothermal vent metagenome TaxID=652676 RepID=A0A3B1CEQ2_9ZZZZ
MAIPVILAVALHEVAHGYVAYLKGDDTAKKMGRLTINPLAHIDLFGTVLLPILFYMTAGFLFAFAKPVPVNFHNLRDPKRDMALVAAAGPAVNILLAIVSALLFKFFGFLNPDSMSEFYTNLMGKTEGIGGTFAVPVLYMLYFSVTLNVVLAVINMIPIPPADGGRVVIGFLPDKQAAIYSRIEPIGLIILILILFLNPFNILGVTIEPLIKFMLGLLLF